MAWARDAGLDLPALLAVAAVVALWRRLTSSQDQIAAERLATAAAMRDMATAVRESTAAIKTLERAVDACRGGRSSSAG